MANSAGSRLLLLGLVARETPDEEYKDEAKNLPWCEPAHTYGRSSNHAHLAIKEFPRTD
jgi:hypothetical protein